MAEVIGGGGAGGNSRPDAGPDGEVDRRTNASKDHVARDLHDHVSVVPESVLS